MYLESNDVCDIIFPHFWYLSNFTCILGSIRLSLANEIDAIHWKRTNIRRVLNQSSSISALDVSVAQLVASASGVMLASASGVVLGGVAEVVGSNLARGKIFTASIGSVDTLYPYIYFLFLFIHSLKRVAPHRIANRCVHKKGGTVI